jgi:hypothetical protein
MIQFAIGAVLVGGAALLGRTKHHSSLDAKMFPEHRDLDKKTRQKLREFGRKTYWLDRELDLFDDQFRGGWMWDEGDDPAPDPLCDKPDGGKCCASAGRQISKLIETHKEIRKIARSPEFAEAIRKWGSWVDDDCDEGLLLGEKDGNPSSVRHYDECTDFLHGSWFWDSSTDRILEATKTLKKRCPRAPSFSGLDKPITPAMAPADFVDELVFRASEFSRNKENTYRELYNEADEDDPNDPKCEEAVASYHETLNARKNSRGAMRAPQAAKLVKKCGNPRGEWSGKGGEVCRRFRWAARRHDDTNNEMKSLRKQIKRWCNAKVPA